MEIIYASTGYGPLTQMDLRLPVAVKFFSAFITLIVMGATTDVNYPNYNGYIFFYIAGTVFSIFDLIAVICYLTNCLNKNWLQGMLIFDIICYLVVLPCYYEVEVCYDCYYTVYDDTCTAYDDDDCPCAYEFTCGTSGTIVCLITFCIVKFFTLVYMLNSVENTSSNPQVNRK